MTTYNTGNPIGSKDPRDLYDNAQAFDQAINGTSETFTDRFGVSRVTLKGATAAIAADVAAVDSAATQGISAISADVAYVGGVADLVAMYLGASATNPTTRIGGAPLQNGDFYLNTASNKMRAYANGSWYATETQGETDASLVNYTPAEANAPATNVETALRRTTESLAATTVAQRGGVIAFMFDDGYASNYTNALPIFRKYGMAATVAVEVDKVGSNYNGQPAYPVCNADQLRGLVRAGWEVTNHPNLTLTDTEAVMVQKAQAENTLLVQYLTGERLAPNAQPGSLTYPEFAGHPVETAVYRGGARNATSDLAYRYVFDKVRSINGTEADRGNHLYAFGATAERTTQMSAFTIDTSNTSMNQILGFIDSVAQTRSTAIVYGHDTPVTTPSPALAPYILASELETILKRCHDLGIAVVPLRDLYKGNAIRDSRFDYASGTFSARSGDSAAFTSADTLHGAARSVQITSSALVANNNTGYSTEGFVVEPFCRYRIRVRYKIDSELNINGTGNWNHGLRVILSTGEGNTMGTGAGSHENWQVAGNDSNPAGANRCPYAVTSGYAEYSVTLVTGNGASAQVRLALCNAIGTVKIGQIIAEKLESVLTLPYSGSSTFNTSAGRTLYLPGSGASTQRNWKWKVEVSSDLLTTSATYDYASTDPALIAAPVNGTTCYVLTPATGAFAGNGGRLATYNGSSWEFSDVTLGAVFKVNNFNGDTNWYVRHLGRSLSGYGPAIYELSKAAYFDDPGYFNETNNQVFNKSGRRSDTFVWYARPVPIGQS